MEEGYNDKTFRGQHSDKSTRNTTQKEYRNLSGKDGEGAGLEIRQAAQGLEPGNLQKVTNKRFPEKALSLFTKKNLCMI